MGKETTTDAKGEPAVASTALLADVIFQAFAPHSGSQQCFDCGGWIIGSTSFYVESKGPLCSCCKEARLKANAPAHRLPVGGTVTPDVGGLHG